MNTLSYHPCIEAGHNRVFGKSLSEDDEKALKAADAVILPQPSKETLYLAANRFCDHVFPNYDAYFAYPGKTGQHALFKKMGVSYPVTFSFQSVSTFTSLPSSLTYPVVFKFSWGGEGSNVFLVNSPSDLQQCLDKAVIWEARNKKGFVLQEYIDTGGRSLRVVVIGSSFYSYWRQAEKGSFYTNLAKGAVINSSAFPDLQKRARNSLFSFCQQTKINLAGFDFLFRENDPEAEPLFLEINFCFRCRGLGGVDRYHLLLEQGIKNWLQDCRKKLK